ncbi:MAG: peptidoglycan DD-metalloendopeptidase family protein [Afipia sp.]|nr:peptidoglycan DD-metalloendopeptidase family protein [Afipia sp.]
MPRFAELSSSRHAPRLAVLALVSLGFAGCSANTSSRFTNNPEPQWSNPFKDWSNPFASKNETTGSVQQQPRELPQYARPRYSSNTSAPVVSAPLSYPSGPAVSSGGGRGVASYAPPSSSPIESTGSVTPPSVAATRAYTREGGTTIIVGTSDTLEIISRRYNVPSHEILAANGYNGPRVLSPGQQLIIPKRIAQAAPPAMSSAPATRASGPMPSSNHVVNRGDTLNNIARRNHITVGQLAAANNMTTTTQLKIGQHIKVPGGQVAAVAPTETPRQAMVTPAGPTKPVAVAATEQPQRAALANEKTAPEPAESAVKTADATNALPTFRWPARGRVVAGYGAKTNGKQNDGINIAVPEGTPVKAAEDGVVAYSGNELKGYGNLILVRHANGYVTAYAHASELMVKRGDSIKRGQVIAKSGQTGEVSSPQLHFEIRKGSAAVDPTQFLGGA